MERRRGPLPSARVPLARRAGAACLLLALLLPAAPAQADVLKPRSGKALRGAIVSESETEVVFNIYWSRNPGVTNPSHVVRLPRAKVKSLERRPHPRVEVFRRLAKAKRDDAAALTAIGTYAAENKLKGHARMCFALALAADGNHEPALEGIGGRSKWKAVRKGNPFVDGELQALLDRYVEEAEPARREELGESLGDRGFKARPHELERYRRAAHQPTGLQVDRPLALGSDRHPGAVYTLFVPKTYAAARPWPLVIGLHGGGPDGKARDEVVGSGPSAMNFYRDIASRRGFLVACPTALMAGWGQKPNEELVRDVIAEVCLLYHIDIDRIYMTGHSMGGFGTWALGPQFAEDLAAISPMAGAGRGGISRLVETRTPIFIYHSDDDYVSVDSDRVAAKQLLDTDLDFVYTELPGKGHGFPEPVRHELFDFFEPRRRYDKRYKDGWPRSSFLGKPSKDEITYLGDPLAAMRGKEPTLKTWLADVRLGGGRALAAVARIAEQKPDGAVSGLAKVLGSSSAPFDARAYAARALGLLGLEDGRGPLRKAVALPASKEQSMIAQESARGLVALGDAEGLDAVEKGIQTWTSFYEGKLAREGMCFSDWIRSTSVLAELVGAWAELAPAEADPAVLEKVLVERVLAPHHEVATSERVPQDPSRTRVDIAKAIAMAYKKTNAPEERWSRLFEALAKAPKAKSAAESMRP
jgi:dienelactone hydrolase